MQLVVSRFSRLQDTKPTAEQVDWGTFAAELLEHQTATSKTEAGLFCLAEFKNGTTRKAQNVERVYGLVIDFDSLNADDVQPIIDRASEYEGVLHSTHSHTADRPRLRLVLPFREPMPAERYAQLYDAMATVFGGKHDPACKDASRLWYLPSCKPDQRASAVAERFKTGQFFDWRTVQQSAPTHASHREPEQLEQRILGQAIGRAYTEGSRNKGWLHLCSQMRDNGKSQSETMALLNAFLNGAPQKAEPFTLAEAQAVAVSVFGRAPREPWKTSARRPARRSTDELLEDCQSLQEVAETVNALLNQKSNRETKQQVADLIATYLLQHERLLVHRREGQPDQAYLRTDAGVTVALKQSSDHVRSLLHDAGINSAEPVYEYIVADLIQKANKEGKAVEVHAWAVRKNGRLYISSGAAHTVVCKVDAAQTSIQMVDAGANVEQPILELLPGGTDGVLFAEDACFPFWEPTDPQDALSPQSLQALNPTLETPPEATGYTVQTQLTLLNALLCLILEGQTTPKPMLTAIGSKGGGKSTLMKGICKLFMGSKGSLSAMPSNQRDFEANLAGQRLYVLDNADGSPEKWLHDALGQAFSGESLSVRQLYTTGDRVTLPIQAFLMFTTRTAQFARASDIKERILPLFFGQLAEGANADEGRMLQDVLRQRGAVLTWLAIRAAAKPTKKRDGYAYRAQNLMAKLEDLLLFDGQAETEADSKKQVKAIGKHLTLAQTLALGDTDPFLLELMKVNDPVGIEGTPIEVFRALQSRSPELQYETVPAPKTCGRLLREWQRNIEANGIEYRRTAKNKTEHFRIFRKTNSEI